MCERLKQVYEKMLQDSNIHEIYKKVDEYDNNMWALHGMQHIANVIKMVERVLTELNCDKEQIYKAKICAYLHDIGAISGKQGHAFRSAEFCKEYLNNFDLTEGEKREIEFAVLNHGNYIDEGGIILAALVFSDKLDIDKTRLGNEGYKIEGMNQLQWIDKISVDIKDELVVRFSCNENFNKKAFEDFYFCKKVFDAIKSFASVIKKEYKVFINNIIWSYGE